MISNVKRGDKLYEGVDCGSFLFIEEVIAEDVNDKRIIGFNEFGDRYVINANEIGKNFFLNLEDAKPWVRAEKKVKKKIIQQAMEKAKENYRQNLKSRGFTEKEIECSVLEVYPECKTKVKTKGNKKRSECKTKSECETNEIITDEMVHKKVAELMDACFCPCLEDENYTRGLCIEKGSTGNTSYCYDCVLRWLEKGGDKNAQHR